MHGISTLDISFTPHFQWLPRLLAFVFSAMNFAYSAEELKQSKMPERSPPDTPANSPSSRGISNIKHVVNPDWAIAGTNAPRLDEFLSRIGAIHVDPSMIETDLLPLAEGNTWVYDKRVPEGRSAFHERELRLKDGRWMSETSGFVGSRGGIHCVEQYEVGMQNAQGQWEIKTTSKEKNCNGKFSGPRDGRYWGAAKVLWSKDVFGKPGIPNLDVRSLNAGLGHIRETIVYDLAALYDLTNLPAGWSFVMPAEEQRIVGMIYRALVPAGKSLYTEIIQMEGSRAEVWSFDQVISVNTPAGSFTNCVLFIERVPPNESYSQWKTGWSTSSYFCPGVGLVKELQIEPQSDRLGKTNYTMELLSYHVAKDR